MEKQKELFPNDPEKWNSGDCNRYSKLWKGLLHKTKEELEAAASAADEEKSADTADTDDDTAKKSLRPKTTDILFAPLQTAYIPNTLKSQYQQWVPKKSHVKKTRNPKEKKRPLINF